MLPIVFLLLVTALNLESATVTNKIDNMDAITFPADGHKSDQSKAAKLQANPLSNKFGEDDVHESCKGLTYCTVKPPNYPEEKYNEMMKNYLEIRRVRRDTNITKDTESNNKINSNEARQPQNQPKIPPLPTFDALGNRQGDISLSDDCDFETTYDPLFQARSKLDEPWRMVIQAPGQGYVQRVRSDICKSTGSSCFKPFLPVPQYETSCEQIYNTWEVLVETEDGKGMEPIKATIPSCCSCKYKYIATVLTRFGEDKSKLNKTKV